MNKYFKLLLVFAFAGVLSIALLAGSAMAQGATPTRQYYGAGCYGMGPGTMGHGSMYGASTGMMGQGMMYGAGPGMMRMGGMRGMGQGAYNSGMMGGAWSTGTEITGTVPPGCPMAGAWGATSTLPISLEQARINAEQYLADNLPGTSLGENQQVYCGHYTFDMVKDDKPAGRLGVNGYTGQVWHQAP